MQAALCPSGTPKRIENYMKSATGPDAWASAGGWEKQVRFRRQVWQQPSFGRREEAFFPWGRMLALDDE